MRGTALIMNKILLLIVGLCALPTTQELTLDGDIFLNEIERGRENRPGFNPRRFHHSVPWSGPRIKLWNNRIETTLEGVINPASLIKSDVGPANPYLQLLLNIGTDTIRSMDGETCFLFKDRYNGRLVKANHDLEAAMINVFLSNIERDTCVWFYNVPGNLANLPVVKCPSNLNAMFGQRFTEVFDKATIESMKVKCYCLNVIKKMYFPPVFPVVKHSKVAIPLHRNTPPRARNQPPLNKWMIRSATDREIWFLSYDPWCLQTKGMNGRDLARNILGRIKVRNYEDYLRLFSLAVGLRDLNTRNLFPHVLVPAPISTSWSDDHTIVDPSAANNEILWAINIWTGHFRPLVPDVFPSWNNSESLVPFSQSHGQLLIWGCASLSENEVEERSQSVSHPLPPCLINEHTKTAAAVNSSNAATASTPARAFELKQRKPSAKKKTNTNNTALYVAIGCVCVIGTTLLVGAVYVVQKIKNRI